MDIKKISSKIWLTSRLGFLEENFIPEAIFVILSKLYRCEEASVALSDLKITVKEFQLFALKFQKFGIYFSQVIDDNGNALMLDKILQLIPNNIKRFEYFFIIKNDIIDLRTMKKISKIKHDNFLTNCNFTLHEVPENFAIQVFDDLIKNQKDVKFYLDFSRFLSEAYKQQLDQLIDVIIDLKLDNCVIYYSGQNEEKMKIMENRFFEDGKYTNK